MKRRKYAACIIGVGARAIRFQFANQSFGLSNIKGHRSQDESEVNVGQLMSIGKLVLVVLISVQAATADWPRFRGTNGSGRSTSEEPPVRWSPTENMLWKAKIPGHGSSSPVIAGEKVFVTCYSGYGLDRDDPGEMQDLRLHLLCFARSDGHLIWERDVPAKLPEREYVGYMIHHGYASATPVAESNAVYAFFGRSGGCAFDHDGNPLWTIDLGDTTHEFGTGGSPIVVDDLVVFNATVESGDSLRSTRSPVKRGGEPRSCQLPGRRRPCCNAARMDNANWYSTSQNAFSVSIRKTERNSGSVPMTAMSHSVQ